MGYFAENLNLGNRFRPPPWLGSVHKYFGGGGAGQNGGGAKKVLSYQKGGTKKFFLSKGGVKKVWSNWKYNENQNAQFVAKISRI